MADDGHVYTDQDSESEQGGEGSLESGSMPAVVGSSKEGDVKTENS